MAMRFLGLVLAMTACSGVSSDPGDGQLVADGLTQPSWLALAGDELYVVSASRPYRLLRVSTMGGVAEVVHTGNVIGAIAADNSGVYWIDGDGANVLLFGLPRGSTTPVQLHAFGYIYAPHNVVIDGDSLYYADVQGTVWKTPKLGGTSVELGKTDVTFGSIAISPDAIWVSTAHGAKRFPKLGGASTELSFSDDVPGAIAWDDGALFAAFSGSGDTDGLVIRVPMTGQPITLANDLVLPSPLIPADGSLYVTTGNSDAAIRRIPQTGGVAHVLARGRRPADVVVDAGFAYWSDPPLGEIRRVPR